MQAEIGRLQRRFDELDIRGGDPIEVTDEVVAHVDELLPAINRLLAQMRLVGSYLYAHTTTDARDDEAAGTQSRYQAATAPFATLDGRFDGRAIPESQTFGKSNGHWPPSAPASGSTIGAGVNGGGS